MKKYYKGIVVRKFPWPRLKVLQPKGLAAFGKIFLRDSLWKDFVSDEPSIETTAMLEHERMHILRLSHLGVRVWLFKFWLDPKFMLQEEIAAITEEMRVYKRNDEVFDADQRAKDLSSVAYRWCIDYKAAKHKLEELWEEV